MTRVFTKEAWPDDEVSTRNCFNAKGYPTQNKVVCGLSGRTVCTWNSAIRSSTQVRGSECELCASVDNDWEGRR